MRSVLENVYLVKWQRTRHLPVSRWVIRQLSAARWVGFQMQEIIVHSHLENQFRSVVTEIRIEIEIQLGWR